MTRQAIRSQVCRGRHSARPLSWHAVLGRERQGPPLGRVPPLVSSGAGVWVPRGASWPEAEPSGPRPTAGPARGNQSSLTVSGIRWWPARYRGTRLGLDLPSAGKRRCARKGRWGRRAQRGHLGRSLQASALYLPGHTQIEGAQSVSLSGYPGGAHFGRQGHSIPVLGS